MLIKRPDLEHWKKKSDEQVYVCMKPAYFVHPFGKCVDLTLNYLLVKVQGNYDASVVVRKESKFLLRFVLKLNNCVQSRYWMKVTVFSHNFTYLGFVKICHSFLYLYRMFNVFNLSLKGIFAESLMHERLFVMPHKEIFVKKPFFNLFS